jgi:glycosyltransferase involved in cell wall biosynthesis
MTGNPYVLHVTKRYPAAVGGDATVVAALVEGQRLKGYRVTIATSRCDAITDGADVRKFGLAVRDDVLDRLDPRRILSCFWGMFWGFRFLRQERPDILHAHCPDLGAALALPARLLGIPRVLTLHGTDIGRSAAPIKGQLERILVRLGRYERLYSVDPLAIPHLNGLARSPARYMPNGIDLEHMNGRAAVVAEPRLIYVGRLDTIKEVDVLIAAVAEARSAGSEAILDILGGGRLESSLRRYADELGLAGIVDFVGSVPREEVMRRLASAAALVLPSRREGFPMVLLEAWANGVPVIATRVGAIGLVCTQEQNALLVPPGDPSSLGSAILRLLNDPALAARLSHEGRLAVERYSQRAVNAELHLEYQAVLAPRSRSAESGRSP